MKPSAQNQGFYPAGELPESATQQAETAATVEVAGSEPVAGARS